MSSPQTTSALVLVVDDEVMVQDLIQSALEDGGFVVVTATTDDEAIEVLESDPERNVVAVVTDVILNRRRTGWDIAKRARELNPAISVVYVTGDSEHDWVVHGVPRSVMLPKPFAPAQLVVAVATLINKLSDD
jgi:CheY-like chemotaxis protein